MKKRNIKLLSLLVALMLVFSLGACGKKDKHADNNGDKEDKKATQQSADVKCETIADYVNSQELQDQLAALRESVSGQDIDVTITSENNILIYTSKYNKLSVEDVDAAAINAGLDSNASSYTALAKALKESTNEENPIVRIVYLASDGQIIVSKDYGIE